MLENKIRTAFSQFASGLSASIITIILILPSNAYSQVANTDEVKWTFATNLVLAGSSDVSDPEGYVVYEALSFEPAIERYFSKSLSVCLKFNHHQAKDGSAEYCEWYRN